MMRRIQVNSASGPCSIAPYALSFDWPMNTWRLPAIWRITKPTPISPVTAMMIFLPIVER